MNMSHMKGSKRGTLAKRNMWENYILNTRRPLTTEHLLTQLLIDIYTELLLVVVVVRLEPDKENKDHN